MKSLPKRLISAIVAIVLFATTYHFFSNKGVFFVSWIACFVGCYEYMRLTLSPLGAPRFLKFLFLFTCANLFFVLLFLEKTSFAGGTLVIVYYMFCSIWILAKKFDNSKILSFISFSVLGFFYSVFLPVFALKLLLLQDGARWFLFLLCIVFAGDILAYFGGVLFGKTRIMPNVSPGKTLAGSVSGLLGSILAGFIFHHFSSLSMSYFQLTLVTFCGGALAQTGDLFESLVKRVASVKDSGQIMPGHGGSLDRFDGVYFAAPLVYSLALSLQNIN